jgi:hypothetical protein
LARPPNTKLKTIVVKKGLRTNHNGRSTVYL